MQKQPLSKKDLYGKLLELKPLFDKFRSTNGQIQLKAENVQLMKDIYPSMQVLSHGAMPLSLQTSCPGCMRDAFYLFIAMFDRLEKDPHVIGSTVNGDETQVQMGGTNAPAESEVEPTDENLIARTAERTNTIELIGLDKKEDGYYFKNGDVAITLEQIKEEDEPTFSNTVGLINTELDKAKQQEEIEEQNAPDEVPNANPVIVGGADETTVNTNAPAAKTPVTGKALNTASTMTAAQIAAAKAVKK